MIRRMGNDELMQKKIINTVQVDSLNWTIYVPRMRIIVETVLTIT